ncbi:MAG: hypothetical protein AB8F94_18865 [Saprospiraceae bacterium]
MTSIRLKAILFFIFLYQIGFAQVAGISYTVSPAGEYVFWNDKAGLEDGFLVGGKLGIGFGEFFEVRASYLQGLDLKNDFEKFGLASYDANTFNSSEVKLTRWGGEIKANISRGRLLPFVLLGTGVQKIELDNSLAREQIYLTGGLGLKLGIADRITLTLEGRNTAYRYNAGANLLNDQDKIDLDEVGNSFQMEDLTNWSAGASLQFYIGGRKPGQMSDLDRAYFDSFTRGSGGLNIGLEAVAGQMNFNDKLVYRNTNMVGASAGFDLGPYIGLNGFYWRGLQDDSFTKFDDISMYGGEMRMRLNTGGGMVPFLMIGGGKLDVHDGYVGKKAIATDSMGVSLQGGDDTGFAMGGAGLLIPLTKNFKIFGSARAVITSGSPADNLAAPEEIQTSWFYSAGVKLNFGKKNKNPNDIVQDKINEQLMLQQEANDSKVAELQVQYDQKILDLEEALIQAYAEQDLEKAAILKEEKQKVEEIVEELEKIDEPIVETTPIIIQPAVDPSPIIVTPTNTTPTTYANNAPVPNPTVGNQNVTITPSGSEIRMSPAEFENLIEEILEGVNGSTPIYSQPAPYNNVERREYPAAAPQQDNSELLRRMDRLEKLLSESITVAPATTVSPDSATAKTVNVDTEGRSETETKLLALMYQLDQKLNKNNAEVAKLIERLEAVEGDKKVEETVEPVKLFDGKKKRRWWQRKKKDSSKN